VLGGADEARDVVLGHDLGRRAIGDIDLEDSPARESLGGDLPRVCLVAVPVVHHHDRALVAHVDSDRGPMDRQPPDDRRRGGVLDVDDLQPPIGIEVEEIAVAEDPVDVALPELAVVLHLDLFHPPLFLLFLLFLLAVVGHVRELFRRYK
jgi:hypothetical protein